MLYEIELLLPDWTMSTLAVLEKLMFPLFLDINGSDPFSGYKDLHSQQVSCSGTITSVGDERANLCAIVTCYYCLKRFPLGAWDGLRYFIVALP